MTTLPVFQRPTTPPPARSWRLTTAARVFALAFAIGQALSAGSLEPAAVVLIALGVLAASACALDLHPSPTTARLAPIGEGVLATTLTVSAGAAATPLLVYLAVPPVVAGLRTGWVTVANTSLAMGIVLIGEVLGARALDISAPNVAAAVPWLVLGLGAGLLAARQTRSVRALEESQAPYVEAHRLLSQLHTVAHNLPGGLDTASVARNLVDRLHADSGAVRTALLVRVDGAELVALAATGTDRPLGEEGIARRCARTGRAVQAGRMVALPVRVAEDTFGAVVLCDPGQHRRGLSGLQGMVDEHGLRLDTSMLFDDVRSLATVDERNRLAREIHDGVGQEVASLGYLVDELAAETDDPATLRAAADLRREVTRIGNELRQSIFDLRHGVEEAGGLSGALAEYVREVCTRSGLRVHLLLDEKGAPLPARTEDELLRIAQEAIANVRKHANAVNLWVTLTTQDNRLRLAIEDDGVGSPAPRAGHYGLHTMRERAERIDADLTISERPDGGTAVTVQSRVQAAPAQGEHHADHRAARR
ncbi:sensor histidine kinase [Nocardioides speluncae]|uniref:sensor histidine kinase n=1 Tax=Nocardioides speluncae TaxID=2670337 RepID=UPI000D68C5DB|nr:sensor histidine kinase [Nocardioides speluncae]